MNQTSHKDLEKQLFRRLKLMGYVMGVISLASFFYAYMPTPIEETDNKLATLPEMESSAGIDLPEELDPKEHLNFYVVSGIFATLGAAAILFSWRKSK